MKLITSLVTASALAVAAAAPAWAQELKLSHQFRANTDGRDRAARVFVDEVTKRDPGIKFRIYPGQSLGIKPVAQLDALQNGTLELSIYPLSYGSGKIPEFSSVILPGTIASLDQAMRLRGSAFHQKLQQVAEANGVRILTWWWTPGGFATKDRAIGGPATVTGLNMRAADSTFESMLKAAGASVVSMPSSEVYPALQSGVLNAILTSSETFVSLRLYEQTKHATAGGEYNLWMLLQPLLMSKQHWDKLTPAQQKIFEEAAAKSDDFFLGLQREATDRMIDAYRKAGAAVRQMTKEEFDQWVELASRTAWPEFAAKTPASKELLDLLSKAK
jgi:TRAP-type transport system periplasmic protein